MKLVTFSAPDTDPHVGVLIDEDTRVVDLTAAGDARHATMQGLIEAGPDALDAARELVDGRSRPREEVTLLAPVPRPIQIRDCLCFEEHLKNVLARRGIDEIPPIYYEQPIYYKANRFSCVGDRADVIWPRFAEILDYELEFAAWIGTGGTDLSAEEAESHIFGYSIFNDVTARDAQFKEMQGTLGPAKGKDFDTGNVLGPCIVTADAVDPHNLVMISRINGEELTRGSSSTMTWTLGQVIAHVTQSETIYPGEVFGSGTVGNGCGAEHGHMLAPGDVVELEIEGIGVLTNRVVRRD
jgi:2-keto-4-pentenoate hydratase/2-oxohepta-3-ene-1,7-dioic acid hydratase in catechol pathway